MIEEGIANSFVDVPMMDIAEDIASSMFLDPNYRAIYIHNMILGKLIIKQQIVPLFLQDRAKMLPLQTCLASSTIMA